jgi:lipoprotein-releasing system permease protein
MGIYKQKKLVLAKIYYLSTAFDIAKKISFQKEKNYTRFIVRLSIAATAISVAAIILTLGIVNGFQKSISNKVYEFWGDIRVASVNGIPLELSQDPKVMMSDSLESITPFINQSAVLSYGQDIEGVVIKGTPANSKIPLLTKGTVFNTQDTNRNDIIISDAIANKLKIPLDSSIRIYLLNSGNIVQRKMKVIGFYHTGIEEYDRQYVLMDIKTVQKLLNNYTQVEGYTIKIKKDLPVDEVNEGLLNKIPKNWVATPIKDYYPQIFDWINVQNVNKNVTITILLIIAIVNLLTCLFILMLERVNMIGTLTAMGASHSFIRQIFLYQASFICWMGIGLGSFIGIGFALLQQKFSFIQLDESAYFIKYLPIHINWLQVLLVIISTAFISYVSFLIPTLWIKKITPAKAIKFD